MKAETLRGIILAETRVTLTCFFAADGSFTLHYLDQTLTNKRGEPRVFRTIQAARSFVGGLVGPGCRVALLVVVDDQPGLF